MSSPLAALDLQAVFMDRDGVLNRYVRADYIRTPDELHLLPGAARAVRMLNDAKLPVLVISNQQGVGKRIMTEDALDQVDGELRTQLRTDADAAITRSYYCIHLAEDRCECRKPRPGLILQAAGEYDLDIARCIMIGDSLTDIEVGNVAGVARTYLLMSGATENVQIDAMERMARPTYIARDLLAAVSHALERG